MRFEDEFPETASALMYMASHNAFARRQGGRNKSFDLTPNVVRSDKVGRNEPCPCGSGLKHKKCCIAQ